MQHKNPYKNFSLLLVYVLSFTLTACTSTENIDKSSQIAFKQQRLNLSSEELMQLKVSSLQWKAAKVGVDRLLVIEQDLKLLIHQLKVAAKQNSNQSKVNKLQPTSKAGEITSSSTLEKSK